MDGAADAGPGGNPTDLLRGAPDALFERLSARMSELASQRVLPDDRTPTGGDLSVDLEYLQIFAQVVGGAKPFVLNVVEDGQARQIGTVTGFQLSRIGSTQPILQADRTTMLRAGIGSGPFGVGALAIVTAADAEAAPDQLIFDEVYVTEDGAKGFSIYATAIGDGLSGAFRWIATTDDELTLDVTSRLFFRKNVAQLGVAPLSSMYLFGPANRGAFDDYRPRVHNSDGLQITSREGLISWRPLTNPPAEANSYIGMQTPARFGLMQRASGFEAYQDVTARYDQKPSLVVEPVGDWGDGFVRLIERPATSEHEDNVAAFWMPKENFSAGDRREFSYRLRWGSLWADDVELAYVAETSAGAGGVSGVENSPNLRKFIVDFKGQPLREENLRSQIDAFVSISRGTVLHTAVSRLAGPDKLRLAIDADIDGNEPVELRAYLLGNGRQLTETWLYQWRRA